MMSAYHRVVVAAGHMIDTPSRRMPRFPPEKEPAVAARIEAVFDDWNLGPGDLLLCGGARGADILFAESAHRRGVDVQIHLALPRSEFELKSVDLDRSIWTARFRYLADRYAVPYQPPEDPAGDVFSQLNARLMQTAQQYCPPAILSMALIWDQSTADGPGGTSEWAVLAAAAHLTPTVIHPSC